jgi:ABC-type hemin transport system substrate-binding protein
MPGEGTEHYIAGLKSYQADLIRCSGADPVGPDENRMVPMNAESLISLNPDVIVVAGKVDSVLADPRLKATNAVKNKKVIGVKQDIILRAGARIDSLIQNLSKELRP